MVAFISTPFLIRGLGESGYGLNVLVGVVIGYFSLMDMGFDLVGTKYVSEDIGKNDADSLSRLVNTTLLLLLALGLVGLIGMISFSKFLASGLFSIPSEMQRDARIVFCLAGIMFFFRMITMWGSGIMCGIQRYDVVNAVAIGSTVFGTVIGLIVVYAGYGIVGYVSIKVFFSLLEWIAYVLLVRRFLPKFKLEFKLHIDVLRRIAGFAFYGFLFRISNIFISGIDKTVIGANLGTSGVTFYSVPYMVSSQPSQFLGRIFNFIFPLASSLQSSGRIDELKSFYSRTTRFVVAANTLIVVPLFVLSKSLLTLWVGNRIASESYPVMEILLISFYLQGVLANTLPNIVMGMGQMRLFTMYFLARGSLVALGCLAFISPFGIMGAAFAQLLAGIADLSLLIYATKHYLGISIIDLIRDAYLRPILAGFAIMLPSFLLASYTYSWLGLIAVATLQVVGYVTLGFMVGVFDDTEKRALRTMLGYIVPAWGR
jgi:O-antigen/teichoic acid export membrane protein